MNHQNLSSVHIGGRAVVSELNLPERIKKRLLDLGMIPGTPVTCLYQAPSGDPRAYLVRDTVIALRNGDAAAIRTL